MTVEVAIEVTGGAVRAALLEDGRLVEVRFADDRDLADRIALGRVVRIEPALDAAFVDLGLSAPGYLQGARVAGLREGETALVQVRREATPGKGPTLTTDLALVGRLLMLRPGRTGTGISTTLARSPAGKSLRARARQLFSEGGVLLRTAAAGADDDDLLREAAALRERWATIEERGRRAEPPAWLDSPGPPVIRLLRELLPARPARIVIGDAAALATIRSFLEKEAPAPPLSLERAASPFEATGAADQLAAALQPELPLAGGGRLIIEPTAALVAIDVDGGPRAALDVNLEAAGEIARQVRLRALGGTIVIDFVDLPEASARKRLDKALRLAFQGDLEPVRIWPIGPLGLVQISRRRRGPSLAERLLRTCPTCDGRGRVEREEA